MSSVYLAEIVGNSTAILSSYLRGKALTEVMDYGFTTCRSAQCTGHCCYELKPLHMEDLVMSIGKNHRSHESVQDKVSASSVPTLIALSACNSLPVG